MILTQTASDSLHPPADHAGASTGGESRGFFEESPMTPTLHILRWNETFENADTRKRERLKFFYAPSGCDSHGYLSLVSRFPQDKAMMAFGVFQALCQLSATLGRSVRGRFENSDGTPMDIQQISCLVRLEICHVSAALEILTDQRVKWCEWEHSAGNLPGICQPPPAFVQGQGQGKGKGEGEGQEDERERNAGGTNKRPTLSQAKAVARNIGITPEKAEEWWNCREASEWMKGMAGGGIAPVGTNWQADMKTYVSRGGMSGGNEKSGTKTTTAASYGI